MAGRASFTGHAPADRLYRMDDLGLVTLPDVEIEATRRVSLLCLAGALFLFGWLCAFALGLYVGLAKPTASCPQDEFVTTPAPLPMSWRAT